MRESLARAEGESTQLEGWLKVKTEAILQAETQLEQILKGWMEHD